MTLAAKTETFYAVARDGEIISDGYTTVDQAKGQLAFLSETMQAIHLTPDVDLVKVRTTTVIDSIEPFIEPAEFEEPAPAADVAAPVGDEHVETDESVDPPAANPANLTEAAAAALELEKAAAKAAKSTKSTTEPTA